MIFAAQLLTAALFVVAAADHAVARATATQATPHPTLPAGAVLAEVRVHGNHTTPDADILTLAGLTVGAPIDAAVLTAAEARLRASGRFDEVGVRQRFRSIEQPSDVLVIIIVNEVAAVSADDLTPGPMRRLRALGMFLPVLDYEDGYGWTYGARVSFVNVVGGRSRASLPLTWGGERRAEIEVDKQFTSGPFTRISAAAGVRRRVHPFFELPDQRRELRGRAERTVTSWLRVGGGARLTHVEFGGGDDGDSASATRLATERGIDVVPSVDVVLDTRIDPAFPRNAVHVQARLERLRLHERADATRLTLDARGYLSLFGSPVLALRAVSERASGPLPPYEQSIVGGANLLRGFEFGHAVGDNLTAASAELRVPVTSPLSVGRLGVKAFIDAAAVSTYGQLLSATRFEQGAGVGAFLTLPVFRAEVNVAWPLSRPGGARWHFLVGAAF